MQKAYAVETPRGGITLPSFHKIVVSCEPWPWSTDSLTVAVVKCSVHNNNTTVGHLSVEFSRLLWHFFDSQVEIECKVSGRQRCTSLIQCGLKIPCYM